MKGQLPNFGLTSLRYALPGQQTPFASIKRLRTQQGIFLAPGDVSQSFMKNLDSLGRSKPERVLKIVIPLQ